jgi:hypothetical protein
MTRPPRIAFAGACYRRKIWSAGDAPAEAAAITVTGTESRTAIKPPSSELKAGGPRPAVESLPDGACSLPIGASSAPYWQLKALQIPLVQSEALVQCLPEPQVGQLPPPQSMSVSVPFWTPSVQLAALQLPPWHTWVVQSEPKTQLWPTAQLGQLPPPQSTSVSVPFFTPSVQLAAWQVPDWQT